MTQKAADDRPYSPSGCCADRRCRDEAAAKGRPTDGYRACDASTCMQLPEGESCSTCVSETRCTAMFGAQSHNTHCQFFPRRFQRRNEETDEGFRRLVADAVKAIGAREVAALLMVPVPTVKMWAEGKSAPHPKMRPAVVTALRNRPAPPILVPNADDPPVPAEPLVVLGPSQRPARVDDLTLSQIEVKLRERGVFDLVARAQGDGPVYITAFMGRTPEQRETIDALVGPVKAEGATLAEALEALLRSANRLTNGT